MTTILLTGIPRSGTTLLTSLLNQAGTGIALAEPLAIRTGDRAAAVEAIHGGIEAIRDQALTAGTVPAKAVDGRWDTDNFFGSPNGHRTSLASHADLPLRRPVIGGFTLYVKHNGLFAALLPELAPRYPIYALVREPVAVLASWQTVDLPVRDGRLPRAERLDPALKARLDDIPDALPRQIALLEWLFARFATLGRERILRFEDMLRHPQAALSAIDSDVRPIKPLAPALPLAEHYPGVSLEPLVAAAWALVPVVRDIYPDIEARLAALAGEGRAVTGVSRGAIAPQDKVNAFVAGVQKGGTTAINAALAAHPEVRTGNRKEPHFFDDEKQDWADPDYAAYHVWFTPPHPAAHVRLDATPIATFWAESLPRMACYNPAAKIVVLLRHPVARAHSQWKMERARHHEAAAFAEVIARDPHSFRDDRARRTRSYLLRGFYAPQIERLLGFYPVEQVLFVKWDRLARDFQKEFDRITDFLAIARFDAPCGYVVDFDSGAVASELTDAVWAGLRPIFDDDIRLTARLTGLDLDDWTDPDYREPALPAPPSPDVAR